LRQRLRFLQATVEPLTCLEHVGDTAETHRDGELLGAVGRTSPLADTAEENSAFVFREV
jgi:hypothetical protein